MASEKCMSGLTLPIGASDRRMPRQTDGQTNIPTIRRHRSAAIITPQRIPKISFRSLWTDLILSVGNARSGAASLGHSRRVVDGW